MVIAHGASWSFFPSTYRVSRNQARPRTRYGNSSIPDSDPSRSFVDGVIAVEPNPFSTLRRLTIDNGNGAGYLGVDYFELISVTGGTWCVLLLCYVRWLMLDGRLNSTGAPAPAPDPTITPTATAFSPPPRSRAGLIVGPIVGVLVLMSVAAGLLYWYFCRRRRIEDEPEFETFGERTFDPDLMVRTARRRTDPRGVVVTRV